MRCNADLQSLLEQDRLIVSAAEVPRKKAVEQIPKRLTPSKTEVLFDTQPTIRLLMKHGFSLDDIEN